MKKLETHTLISVLIMVTGLVLMAGTMYVDSEPGGIPLLLVVFGIGWYAVARIRARSHHQ